MMQSLLKINPHLHLQQKDMPRGGGDPWVLDANYPPN